METDELADVRSIFVEARTYGDNVGSSYFSARVWVNGKWVLTLPFQYGSESQSEYEAVKQLVKAGLLPSTFEKRPLWHVRDDLGVDTYSVAIPSKKSQMFKVSEND